MDSLLDMDMSINTLSYGTNRAAIETRNLKVPKQGYGLVLKHLTEPISSETVEFLHLIWTITLMDMRLHRLYIYSPEKWQKSTSASPP